MNKNPIEILPSSRSIRARIMDFEKLHTSFLPDFMTMSEFLNRVCVVEGFIAPDADTRVLLLLEASNFSNFEILNIERNFFTFTQNSSYIFNFFTELAGEGVDISLLESADSYAEYEQHLAILNTLYHKYKMLCMNNHILDPIFLPSLYKLNKHQLVLMGHIKIFVEGYLTNFEFDLIHECSQCTEVTIVLSVTRFSDKMISKFKKLGFDLVKGYEYELDISKKQILSTKLSKNYSNIICYSFEGRLVQVAFVKKMIFDYINIGIKPQEIVVIVPDESFAKYLKLYDEENNFNFAMGYPFCESGIYKYLDASCQYIETPTEQNRARLFEKEQIFMKQFPRFIIKI